MCQNVVITCRFGEKEDANKFGGDEEGHWHTHGQLISGGEFEQGGCYNATWNPSQGVLLSNNTLLLILTFITCIELYIIGLWHQNSCYNFGFLVQQWWN